MITHPIAYPCGCVFVFEVNAAGWILRDRRDPNYQGVGSKICRGHVKELDDLGEWY